MKRIGLQLTAATVIISMPCAVYARVSLEDIPPYSGEAYIEVNGNAPSFDEVTTEPYEYYSPLDSLGRCGEANANVCIEIMPTGKRGNISSIKPAGWHTTHYEFVSGKSLYNRSHLIGYQLAGENANAENLITGTRYLNATGMLPFENAVADYVEENNAHVMYRVTPLYEGNNLIANGVEMEAYSVEDNGEGICFDVYCYNVQPGIQINYADGTNRADGTVTETVKEVLPDVSASLHGSDINIKNKPASTKESGFDRNFFLMLLDLIKMFFNN